MVLGQSPRFTNSPVPMTDAPKRAKASLTIVAQNPLPNIPTQITLTETNKAQTQSGALIQSISGQNKCLHSSSSLFNQVWTTNADSIIISFSSQNDFANAFCPSFPTTTPPKGGYTVGKSICTTLDKFVGSSSTEFSSSDSNSAIAQIVALKNNNDFKTLSEIFTQVTVDGTNVTIDGVIYPRSTPQIDTIIRELAYIINISSKLSTFGTVTTDAAVDMMTFVISSANTIDNNTKLVELIEQVIQKAIEQYAVAYNNDILSAVIISGNELNASQPCQISSDSKSGLGQNSQIGAEIARTDAEVRQYQITLWLVIALVSVVIFGFGSTATMHILPDAALQGGMSTYWTHKK